MRGTENQSTKQTRAGVLPVQQDPKFEITTQKAEEWINKRLTQVREKLEKEHNHKLPEISVVVATAQQQRSTFLPFVVLLPANAEFSNSKGGKKDRVDLDIFYPEEEAKGKHIRLVDYVYMILEGYMYNKKDQELLFSQEFRKAVNLSYQDVPNLKRMAKPFYYNFKGNNKYRMIGIMLDPRRIFKDMVTYTDGKDNSFEIDITEVQKLSKRNYKYSFTRASVKYKGKDRNFQEYILGSIDSKSFSGIR